MLTIREIMEMPEPAKWRALHHACVDEVDAGHEYGFDVARARKVEHVLGWTLHLSEKDWFEYTDWTEFVRSAMNKNGVKIDV